MALFTFNLLVLYVDDLSLFEFSWPIFWFVSVFDIHYFSRRVSLCAIYFFFSIFSSM